MTKGLTNGLTQKAGVVLYTTFKLYDRVGNLLDASTRTRQLKEVLKQYVACTGTLWDYGYNHLYEGAGEAKNKLGRIPYLYFRAGGYTIEP